MSSIPGLLKVPELTVLWIVSLVFWRYRSKQDVYVLIYSGRTRFKYLSVGFTETEKIFSPQDSDKINYSLFFFDNLTNPFNSNPIFQNKQIKRLKVWFARGALGKMICSRGEREHFESIEKVFLFWIYLPVSTSCRGFKLDEFSFKFEYFCVSLTPGHLHIGLYVSSLQALYNNTK